MLGGQLRPDAGSVQLGVAIDVNTASGGTTDPFMISWPAKYPGNGELRHQYGHAIDMVPTVLDLIGDAFPGEELHLAGRLDRSSTGLLLLTNDGGIKRRLELPATGWVRKYRVRVNGRPADTVFEPLRKGIVLEGERFQPMSITAGLISIMSNSSVELSEESSL